MPDPDYTRLLERVYMVREHEVARLRKSLDDSTAKRRYLIDGLDITLPMLRRLPLGNNWSVRQANAFERVLSLLEAIVRLSR